MDFELHYPDISSNRYKNKFSIEQSWTIIPLILWLDFKLYNFIYVLILLCFMLLDGSVSSNQSRLIIL